MNHKWLGVLVMGALSLVLASLVAALFARHTLAGIPALWVSWAASLAVTGFVARRATSGRTAWALLSLINGSISIALVLANAVLPASAAAPYEPGSDWLRSVDLTPPIAARLREAMASGYFAIGVLTAGIILLAAAYLLLHRSDGSSRHAH